ncbi:MAG: hypothetical protein P4M00_19300 [Azospirillaceae bacterium]|nr:hypothetical protein [Azospirillaceae bacterium]
MPENLIDLRQAVQDNGCDIGIAFDGVRVTTTDGWRLLRASNTEDLLVVRCESLSQAGLERLMAMVAVQLCHAGIAQPDGS